DGDAGETERSLVGTAFTRIDVPEMHSPARDGHTVLERNPYAPSRTGPVQERPAHREREWHPARRWRGKVHGLLLTIGSGARTRRIAPMQSQLHNVLSARAFG